MGLRFFVALLVLFAVAFMLLPGHPLNKISLTELGEKIGTGLSGEKAVPQGKARITFSTKQKVFSGKSFLLTNSTFQGWVKYKEIFSEIAGEKVKIGKKGEDGEVPLRLVIEKGRVSFGGFGENDTVKVFASTKELEIGDFTLTPNAPVEVLVEFSPSNFTMTGVYQEELRLDGVSGELKSGDGRVWVKLDGRNVTFVSFLGSVVYDGRQTFFLGNVGKVLINGNDITNIVVGQ